MIHTAQWLLLTFIININNGFGFYLETSTVNPDAYLTTPEMCTRHGYEAETHTVETEDGYLLNIHRILPRGDSRKGVAYLQHGLLSSSADWVLTGPSKGLGYLLADKGYDVWLGNIRGNTYSRAHRTLKPSDSSFWQFSWDEMAQYDVPAIIDHILNVTQAENLNYIGHSMGTTMFFAMAASKPEYQSKIKVMVAMAPVAFMAHTSGPLKYLAPWEEDLEMLQKLIGYDELLPQGKFLEFMSEYFCNDVTLDRAICENFLFLLAGFDKDQMSDELIPVILGHTPAGTSSQTAIHFVQLIKSGRFRKYDFGKKINQQKYNSITPPEYNLKSITVPIAALYADNDEFVNESDLEKLLRNLPNVIKKYEVPLKTFNHVDFVFAKDAPTLVYEEVLSLLDRKNTNNPFACLVATNDFERAFLKCV